MSRSWEKGTTRAWSRTRRAVLLRDADKGCRAHREGWCAMRPGAHVCEEGNAGVVWHAHHTHGRAVTGDDPRFIVKSCPSCNRHIASPEQCNPQPKRVTRW